jgi:hypothetical protein
MADGRLETEEQGKIQSIEAVLMHAATTVNSNRWARK